MKIFRVCCPNNIFRVYRTGGSNPFFPSPVSFRMPATSPERDMYNTFNMGLGMVMAVAKEDADKALASIQAAGETGYIIGTCCAGDKGVQLR